MTGLTYVMCGGVWCAIARNGLAVFLRSDLLYFSDRTCCIFLIREINDDGERVMNESTAMKLSFKARRQLWWPSESMPLYIEVQDRGKNYWVQVQVRERARGRVLIGRNVDATPGVWPGLYVVYSGQLPSQMIFVFIFAFLWVSWFQTRDAQRLFFFFKTIKRLY